MAVETTDEPFTREYSVESFGTDYLFRVRIRLGFKVSQSIPAYLHQIMHDLEKTGELRTSSRSTRSLTPIPASAPSATW